MRVSGTTTSSGTRRTAWHWGQRALRPHSAAASFSLRPHLGHGETMSPEGRDAGVPVGGGVPLGGGVGTVKGFGVVVAGRRVSCGTGGGGGRGGGSSLRWAE